MPASTSNTQPTTTSGRRAWRACDEHVASVRGERERRACAASGPSITLASARHTCWYMVDVPGPLTKMAMVESSFKWARNRSGPSGGHSGLPHLTIRKSTPSPATTSRRAELWLLHCMRW
eukprot:771339-Prymnesium_polylepis.1